MPIPENPPPQTTAPVTPPKPIHWTMPAWMLPYVPLLERVKEVEEAGVGVEESINRYRDTHIIHPEGRDRALLVSQLTLLGKLRRDNQLRGISP